MNTQKTDHLIPALAIIFIIIIAYLINKYLAKHIPAPRSPPPKMRNAFPMKDPKLTPLNNPSIIDTYEKLLANTPIEKIVTTCQTKLVGYLKLKDLYWKEIREPNDPSYDKSIHETLESIIMATSYVTYHLTLLKSDIMQKCYCPEFPQYTPNYHEYIIQTKNAYKVFNVQQYKLFDFKHYTLSDLPLDQIITKSQTSTQQIDIGLNEPDTQIIDYLFLVYTGNITHVNIFKQLCKNVLIEFTTPVLFRECIDPDNQLITLSGLLRTIMRNLGLNDDIIRIHRHKGKQLLRPRERIYLHNTSKEEEMNENIIADYTKFLGINGMRNVIIHESYKNIKEPTYNLQNINKFISTNTFYILTHMNQPINPLPDFATLLEMHLMPNILHWIAS